MLDFSSNFGKIFPMKLVKFSLFFFLFLAVQNTVFPMAEEYYIEMGKTFLKQNYLEEAENSFKKALLIDPANKEAQQYLSRIKKQVIRRNLNYYENGANKIKSYRQSLDNFTQKKKIPAQSSPASNVYEKQSSLPPADKGAAVYPGQLAGNKGNTAEFKHSQKEGNVVKKSIRVSGNYQLSFGVNHGDFLWKRANYDLNERNWRILSDSAYNLRENTFDPAIYSALNLNLDSGGDKGFSFHTNLAVDPWSFVGKTRKVTVTSSGGDTADVQILYWSNTGYTVNQTIYTQRLGDAFNIPELKVKHGTIAPFSVTSTFGNTFNIPELKVDRTFQPLREMWLDYNQDAVKLRVYPWGLEDQAYTSDDPLVLSNNKIYWEESQWLTQWSPGHFNSGAGALDYYPGWWNDSLAFFTRDSSGRRLTALRGFNLAFGYDRFNLDFAVASPKNLWQDYDSFDTLDTVLRLKYFLYDNLTLGGVFTSKTGYAKDSLDAYNNVYAFDFNYGFNDTTEMFFEVASSYAKFDRGSDYETKRRGNAYQISFINSSASSFGKHYEQILPKKNNPFYKTKLVLTHMDRGFRDALSSYRETRDDPFWAEHLHFRKPLSYHFSSLFGPSLSWDDIRVNRIGNGIDYGRDVINFQWEADNLWEGQLDALFDIRNVHATSGKYIENVARLETTYHPQSIPKLTTKFLGIYHDLPKTKAGIDPYMIDPQTGDYYQNNSVQDGDDPSTKTVSLGLKYDFTPQFYSDFIWERTNDIAYAYDNFPRGLLTWSSFSTYYEYDRKYRQITGGLNYANEFAIPHPYYNIFKVGLGFKPLDNLDIYLDWGRNEYEWAQIIDDNSNHIGLEISYVPVKKLALYFRYVFSRVKDISELNENGTVQKHNHHDIFCEARLRFTKDSELVTQYGVGISAFSGTSTYSPYGGSVPTLDTEHIFRMYYRRKF